MRRIARHPRTMAVVAIAIAAIAPAAAGATAVSRPLTVTAVSRFGFPERGFLLALRRPRLLDAAHVHVIENGAAVPGVKVVSAVDAQDVRLGVVLAIDSSDSMKGAPIRAALAAAKSLVDHGTRTEDYGVVVFNGRVAVVRRLAPAGSGADAGLSRVPSLALGTHIYDGVGAAIELLRHARSPGSVLVLSDGTDTGSSLTSAAVIARARAAGVRIFAIGLRSATFDPAALRRLTIGTGGIYATAESSDDIARVYAALGRQISNQYVVEYRSSARPGDHVVVSVTVDHVGSGTADYNAPRSSTVGPFHRSWVTRFILSPASMLVLSLLAAGVAGGVAAAAARGTRSTIAARIGRFVTVVPQPATADEQRAPLTDRLAQSAERSLRRLHWWGRFVEELELAEISVSPGKIVLGTFATTIVVGFTIALVLPVFVLAALAVPFLVRAVILRRVSRARDAFAEQLPDNLQVLASALRAGHAFTGALRTVADEADEPSRREFQRVVADEQLGVPVEQALRAVAHRMANRELEQVALVAELQRQAGGNMAEVLDTVVETIRDRFDLRRLVRTLTAQGRLARWIVTLLPGVLALFITLINPTYMLPFLRSTGGQVALLIATLMVVAGSLVIKRIVTVRV